MFEGEKTFVFWVGLIIFALACIVVFSALWYLAIAGPYSKDFLVKFLTPFIVGAVVFIIVGFYMMMSGVKKQIET